MPEKCKCLRCKHILSLIDVDVDVDIKAKMRQRCTECKQYKGDNVLLLLRQLKHGLSANIKDRPARGSVVDKRYSKAVLALRGEGRSLRDISSMLGIAVNSVRKILADSVSEPDPDQISII